MVRSEADALAPASPIGRNFLCALFLGAFAILVSPIVQANPRLWVWLLTANVLLLGAVVLLYAMKWRGLMDWTFSYAIKPTHWVQAMAQGSLYVYWSLYWRGVREYAPLILYQIVFAYLLEFLVSAIRRRHFKIGYSLVPMVFSFNLFVWFKTEYYYGQLLMIAAAVLCKAFVVWQVNGERRHIFNPSGGIMAVVSILAVLMNSDDHLRVGEIIFSYGLVPHFHLLVFVVGCFSQWVGQVSLVSLGALGTLVGTNVVCQRLLGHPLTPFVVHPSVFIGLTLLVTDPMTSPRSKSGQLLYGILYGLGIIGASFALMAMRRPQYFDKILVVPLLNLLAPYLDRGVARWKNSPWLRADLVRIVPAAAYAMVFAACLPYIRWNMYRQRSVYVYLASHPSPHASAQIQVQMSRRKQDICQAIPTTPGCR